MKKVFAVLLALTLVLSMGTVAFAADTGSITITNAATGATYSIYKMFDFEPVTGSTTQGRYTVVEEWKDFIADGGKGADYLEYNTEAGTIKWKGEDTAERRAELAKAAIAYAEDLSNDISATATQTAENDTVVFSNLDYGYYAIDTSLGTICALTTATPNATAEEKNAKPEIDKEVQEDSKVNNANEGWGKVNDADIGQTVNFRSTITVVETANNYKMHDTMSDGLTFNANSVTVTVNETAVSEDDYTITTTGLTDGCTFEIAFEDSYIETLKADTKIVVTYSATLNKNAVVAGEGNLNKVYLSYGEDSEFQTTVKETKTYTWKMDVFKYTNGDNNTQTALEGAKFQLLGANDAVIKFSKVAGEEVPTYMVDAKGEIIEITTDKSGKFEIVGLDEGSYKLHETEAPAGYNKLADDKVVVIASTYNDTNLTATYTIDGKIPATIEVENKTGSLLPETGGIGTTIFYVVGIVLMLAAVIILITKKRMSSFA